MILVFSMIK